MTSKPTHVGIDAGAAFWLLGICYHWIPQVGQLCAKKLKDLANSIVQYATSLMIFSVVINSIMVPSLESVVLPICEKIVTTGSAGIATVYWMQRCSARVWHMHCQHVHTLF